MAKDTRSVADRVKEIIVNQGPYEEKEVTPDASLVGELGMDSLDLIEMTMAIEEAFDVTIPDEDLEKWKTVADVIAYAERCS